ncbi:MAG: WbqC family protein [Bacteroidota bacterium]
MRNDPPLIMPTAYFPPAEWIRTGAAAGAWSVEARENYQKGGWRNRCRIAGPNGPQTLSVPLEKGKHQRKPIREVRISYRRDWWREHEQAIRSAYGRAPYFEFYAEAIFTVGRRRPETLWELNESLLRVILEELGVTSFPVPTIDFVPPGGAEYRWAKDLPPLPAYPQVFTDRFGYQPGLSVLDGLFCLGPGLL